MADESRTLTANFTADTSGFSPQINELIQRLKSLNGEFQENQNKLKSLQSELKEYQQKLNELNRTTGNGSDANAEQRQQMQDLQDAIARCNTQIGTYRAAQTNIRSQITSTNRALVEQQNAFAEQQSALNDTSDALEESADSAQRFGDVLKANLVSSAITAG